MTIEIEVKKDTNQDAPSTPSTDSANPIIQKLKDEWLKMVHTLIIAIFFSFFIKEMIELGAPTNEIKNIAYLALATVLLMLGKLGRANWGRYIPWMAIPIIIVIALGWIFYLENKRPGTENTNPIQILYNRTIGDGSRANNNTANKEKECTDCELLNSGQYKVVVVEAGEKPENYLRLPKAGHPFHVGYNNEQTHFYLKTRSGKIITFAQIKSGHFYINERDFMVVPTKNKKLKVGIEVT